MNYKCFIGVDVSKNQLDIACYFNNEITFYTCKNNVKAIEKVFMKILKDLPLSKSDILTCAEYTGHYSNLLIRSMLKMQFPIWMESPNQIFYSQGLQRGKNDKVDAERIASYCKRYTDRAKLMLPSNACIENLAYLVSERELLVKDLAKYKSQISDHQPFIESSIFKNRKNRLQKLMKNLKAQILDIEEEMDVLVRSDGEVNRKMNLLQSVQGVGKQVALNTIIATKDFQKFDNARKFACHVGVAPFEYISGSSIRSAKKVSKKANKKLKSLFHMAALSAIQREGDLQKFYQRKVAEGKNKMTVINAVRAKIISRMFAVIKKDREYEKNYMNSLA